MIKQTLVLISIILTLFLTASISIAAPTINWENVGEGVTKFYSGFKADRELTNVSVEEKYAGDNESNRFTYNNLFYDVEKLGIYINDNILYIGLQTDFNFICEPDVKKGDFMFELEESNSAAFSDNDGDADFAFSFSLNGDGSADMTLFAEDLIYDTSMKDANDSYTGYGTDFINFDTRWGVTGANHKKKFNKTGTYSYDTFWGIKHNYTIEAAIDLNELSSELTTLFSGWSKQYTHVTMYWQMSCGNDFLAARSAFGYTPPESPVPEPATLLLFGMGLLGAGAYGRRKI